MKCITEIVVEEGILILTLLVHNSARKGYGSDRLGGINHIAPMVKTSLASYQQRGIFLEVKASYNDMNYNQGYRISTADFNANPMTKRTLDFKFDEMNTEQQTYYAKLRAELNSNITNNLTVGYNRFHKRLV